MNGTQCCRRVLSSAAIALLSLCLALPAAAAKLGDVPEVFRSFIQSRYGIIIRMGDECGDCEIGKVELQIIPEEGTPFQKLAAGEKRFAGLLKNLDHAVAVYPPGFFSRFQPALRFWLADKVLVDGNRVAGFFSYADGHYEIALSRLDSDEGSPHHEIWHAMEHLILEQEPDAFGQWDLLNPEDFAYTGDYTGMQADQSHPEPEDCFVSEYATVSGEEDRAMVFRALMTRDETWWSTRPHLRKKAEFLLKKAEPVFGKISVEK
jgi:hypothetical protein